MDTRIKLDRTDFGILDALQNDARLSNKELAARVGLAPSSCLERVRRLRSRGVLRGCHASVDPKALGVGVHAMITVRVRHDSRGMIEQFHDHVLGLPEAISIYHVSGANDFLIHVAVRDTDHLRDFALEAFAARTEVEHLETALVFGYERKPVLPNYAATAPPAPRSDPSRTPAS